jgi:hypothetical protein
MREGSKQKAPLRGNGAITTTDESADVFTLPSKAPAPIFKNRESGFYARAGLLTCSAVNRPAFPSNESGWAAPNQRSMLLTVAGQLPIRTAFPILPAGQILSPARHPCYNEYIKRTAQTQPNFSLLITLTFGAGICKLYFCELKLRSTAAVENCNYDEASDSFSRSFLCDQSSRNCGHYSGFYVFI